MVNDEIIKEIDKTHELSNEALKFKQFDRYIEYFSENLKYVQLNGKEIGKRQLIQDITNYFRRIKSFSSKYERKDYTINKDCVVETLVQQSKVSLRIFIFFSKNWTVEREGVYEWIKVNDSWKIVKVKILKEKVF
ncbi:MAG TPA: hypothetical protein VK668_20910 [Mucilaginibacter sp.]|nr:hypothetical protein [Mucilaginibacter sp.]